MGFRIRKSINLFPGFKINLSKKGIGWSAGIKGLRINSKGQYNIGTGPITYQGSLDNNKKSSNKSVNIVYIFIFCMLLYFLFK